MGRESGTILRAFDQAVHAIVVADSLGRITYANEALAHLVGLSRDRMRGRHFSSLMSGDLPVGDVEEIALRVAAGHTWSGPLTTGRADGSTLHLDLTVSPVRDEAGAVTHSIAMLRDVTQERDLADALTRDLHQQASIGAALSRLDPRQPIGMLATDVADALLTLDGVGLARLIAFGSRERGQVLADRSRGAALPRQLLVPPARTRHLLQRAAEGPWVEAWVARREYGRYGRELKAAGVRAVGFAPLRHEGRAVGVIAIGSLEPRDIHVLERHLSALSHFGALVSGLLGPALAAHQHDADLRAEIERLIAQRAFTSVFQPIVRLADREPIAYEALTRFVDGNPPERRFADADAVGLGAELESVTLRAALEGSRALPPEAKLSINVSPRFILQSGTMSDVLRTASRPIILELTEREPIEDYAALRKAIAGLGVAVDWAVDDAGAGYASLRHIIEIRPEYVKLDRGLVSGIGGDPIRQALVAGIMHFAASTGLQIIAEGVETDTERSTLSALGVEFGQGYLFGRPEPAATMPHASQPGPNQRCEGQNRNFEPCRIRVQSGQRFCRFHHPKAPDSQGAQWVINDRAAWLRRRIVAEINNGLSMANMDDRALRLHSELRDQAGRTALVLTLEQLRPKQSNNAGIMLMKRVLQLIRAENRRKAKE